MRRPWASARPCLTRWPALFAPDRPQASRTHRFAFRTSVLAVSLLDRFLSRYVIKARPPAVGASLARSSLRSPAAPPQPSLPWLLQLAAVAALSTAAKMEETTVPLLADLQARARGRPRLSPAL